MINFSINSTSYSVNPSDFPPETTLNDFIRNQAQLPGTKFMCNEGGCGCCTVTAKQYDLYNKYFKTYSLNSCLKLLSTCDGLEITTIEGVGNKLIGYHPIQSTLANLNGTQCGYCSPGMVMTMYGLMQGKPELLTRKNIENSFDGNICRCTGYRPILEAMKSFASSDTMDIEDLTKKCKKLKIRPKPKISEGDEFDFLDEEVSIVLEKELSKLKINRVRDDDKNLTWYHPNDFDELFEILENLPKTSNYYFVCGGTGHGVYRRPDNINIFINLNKISDMFVKEAYSDKIEIGANTSITDVLDLLLKASYNSGFEYCKEIYQHWSKVATLAVRNIGGLGGNLMIKHTHNTFPSDIFVVLAAVNARIRVMDHDKSCSCNSAQDFLEKDMDRKLITKICLYPYCPNEYKFKSYKVMIRSQNAAPLLNAAFLVQLTTTTSDMTVQSANLCFGNIASNFINACQTEAFMVNKNLLTQGVVEQILAKLYDEIQLDEGFDYVSQQYRHLLACTLLYKFFLSIIPSNVIAPRYLTGKDTLTRPVSSGTQTFSTPPEKYPVGEPVIKIEAKIQCSGEAFYSNDLPPRRDDLWAAYVTATHVGSVLVGIDASKALEIPDIVAFFGASDIPGVNSFVLKSLAPIFFVDEPVFLQINSVVLYYNQPVGVIVGSNRYALKRAVKEVKLMYETQPIQDSSHNFTLKDLRKNNKMAARTITKICRAHTTSTKSYRATKTIQSNFSCNGQFHFTMEPQTTICIPRDDGIKLYCANQFIDLHHIVLSNFLNMPQDKITVKTVRLGGGYGAKFSRPGQVACAAALASTKLNRPIRFVLSIEEMMRTIGKRTPFESEYDVEVDGTNGKITKFKINFYVDLGWNTNESAMIPYALPAIKSCYKEIENWTINGHEVTTDAASNTWCRSPGSFEGIAMIETIMENIAYETGLDPVDVRLNNIADDNKMKVLLPQFVQSVDYHSRKQSIEQFNNENRWRKKGISISIMKFLLIPYGPQVVYLVVYHGDGTVNISHAGIEMGQGLNTKVLQVAAYTLGIPMENISMRPSNSFTSANSAFTAGSYASEAVSLAVKKACETLNDRLKPIRDSLTNPTWLEVIQKAYAQNVTLNVVSKVTPDDLHQYDIYGLACSEVEVDVLTGQIQVTKVDILEDTGESLSPLVDIGQIEGAFIMGLGLWLTEKLIYDNSTGELLTDRPFNYKVPLATDIPINFNINLIQNNPNPVGVLRSKSTGEPAVCLAISALFALRQALLSARKDAGIPGWLVLNGPATPEEILINSGTSLDQLKLQ